MSEIDDLQDRSDIEQLVNSFYDHVKNDEVIGYFFETIAKIDWDQHLPKMYDFWESIIFGKAIYKGNTAPIVSKSEKAIIEEKIIAKEESLLVLPPSMNHTEAISSTTNTLTEKETSVPTKIIEEMTCYFDSVHLSPRHFVLYSTFLKLDSNLQLLINNERKIIDFKGYSYIDFTFNTSEVIKINYGPNFSKCKEIKLKNTSSAFIKIKQNMENDDLLFYAMEEEAGKELSEKVKLNQDRRRESPSVQ